MTLLIENLENIVNPCDALAADLKNKTHLVDLNLTWNFKRNNEDSIKQRELSILNYSGRQFPRWLSDKFLLNVLSLGLYNCKYCQWLPSIGLLTFLKHLEIEGLDEINLCITSCKQLVASTNRVLEIEDDKMETSSFDMIGHHLQSFSIFICPGMNIPINHCYHFLVQLHILQCCDSLTDFPLDLFPKLRELDLGNCRNLQIISQGHPHRHLKSLSIQHCSEFESFPNEGLFGPQLKRFCIIGMEKLKSMPKRMFALLPSLHYVSIHDCPEVELSEGCLPSNLKEMRLLNCSKLVVSLKKGAMWSVFQMKVCSHSLLLDYKGLCHLSSLRKLVLENC
ncbi:hypothetical protein PHAVU_011G191700 [Phaseolus vulgaris]|uniref:R13L1/DRL21-like LRR repeat region domain-containing protein n=1 Tax=Phaseolus vulgaris TaxID=3885 RepID=V7AJ03_PHAVU|nr:hypothetical protein PHAVU_011G191700g [Phaseolus vulgaris]ESW05582.1 hypothetical protein PHAVU_011G191700g [Phaseolus vulgaris]